MFILPYCDNFRAGVIAVLKRNYSWMSHVSDEYLSQWLTPIIAYKWTDDFSASEVQYKYGAVLADDEKITGFFGAVCSFRQVNGKKRLCMTFSTWAIDMEYRAYFLKAIKTLIDAADIVLDLTPNIPSRETATKMFGFKYFCNERFVMLPVPLLSRKNGKVHFINDANEITDPELRTIFEDHKTFGVKCVMFEFEGDTGFMFYVSRKAKRWKGIIPRGKKLRAVKVVNEELFAKNAHMITWEIQKHEGILATLEVDACFIDGKLSHPLYVKRESHRLMLSKSEENYRPDFMYSELSILSI